MIDIAGYVVGMPLLVERVGEGAPLELVLGLHVVCGSCGEHTVYVAGHHVKALRAVLDDAIRDFPDLTGNDPREH